MRPPALKLIGAAALAAMALSCGDSVSPELTDNSAAILVSEPNGSGGARIRRLEYGGLSDQVLVSDDAAWGMQPAWPQPGGNIVLYTRTPIGGGGGTIERVGLQGSLPALTRHGGVAGWSPDGSLLLWDEFGQLMVTDPDGGSVDSLALGYDAVWSPDGSRIYFSYAPANTDDDIGTVPLVGSHLRQNLTNNPATDIRARVSPDGRLIAFVSGRAPGAGIYLMGSNGGQPHRILAGTNLPAAEWAPSGRYLTVARSIINPPDPHDELVVIDTTGATVGTMRFPTGGLGTVAWAPTRDILLVVAQNAGSPTLQAFLYTADGRHRNQLTASGIGGAVWMKR